MISFTLFATGHEAIVGIYNFFLPLGNHYFLCVWPAPQVVRVFYLVRSFKIFIPEGPQWSDLY